MAKKLNDEFLSAQSQIQVPGPVLNFDLVELSPVYTKKMHSILNINMEEYSRSVLGNGV